MATSFPNFVDLPEGQEPEDGVHVPVDAAYLNSVNTAINLAENAMDAKADSDDLATVATSGAYTDLIGPPFIPTEPGDIGAQPAGDYATSTDLDGKADVEHTHPVGDLTVTGTASSSTYLRGDGAWATPTDTTDHGSLTGLADDDHTQYHNDTRGDARYYTQTAADTLLDGKADTAHSHAASDIGSGRLTAARLPVTSSTVRSATYATTMTVDPTTDGNLINIGAPGDITSLVVSTTGATDRQALRIAVLAEGAEVDVTFSSSTIRASTNLALGPHTVPSGQVLLAAVEYLTVISAWVLTAATVSES